MVCAPVDVGSGVEDANARQCCYKVAAKGLAKPHPKVATKDGTFTGSQLEVLKSQLICEPCGADLVPYEAVAALNARRPTAGPGTAAAVT